MNGQCFLQCRLSLVARNADNLNKVAEACRTAGALDVLVLSKDLSVTNECISAVEDTVAHFQGKQRNCKKDQVDSLVNYHSKLALSKDWIAW